MKAPNVSLCVRCGCSLNGHRVDAKYCSNKCRASVNKRQRRMKAGHFVVGQQSACLRCEATFDVVRTKHVYCSDTCSKATYNERCKAAPRTCKCRICENDFMPNSSMHQICSKACHVIQRRRRTLAAKYGLDEDTFNNILRNQDNVCAICLGIEVDRWAVDHDHACCDGDKTCGKCIRGILCFRCNTALGLLKDSPLNVSRALAYLSRGK